MTIAIMVPEIGKSALCIQCGCCVSECNSMESDPDFLGPAALAKAQHISVSLAAQRVAESDESLIDAPCQLGRGGGI